MINATDGGVWKTVSEFECELLQEATLLDESLVS